ncbi:MAG: tetraacyldisaccharide 4'-kinase [Pseudomonadota bacterium]
MRAPDFWWQRPGLLSTLLMPAACFYGAIADRPFGKGKVPPLPLICVGNFVAGGAGKTPVALALAALAQEEGLKPAFLTRGYGGRVGAIPSLVQPTHTAEDVGDEALLLARHRLCVVARDRRAGASMIADFEQPSNLILMDDGFQSATLKPTHALLVVDHARGLGNGLVIPAGPLRARLKTQIANADSLLVVRGAGRSAESVGQIRAAFEAVGKPVLGARLAIDVKPFWKERKVIAFCGIAAPEKFFGSLEAASLDLIARFSFPDHHTYRLRDLEPILADAHRNGAIILTTEKDKVRLKGRAEFSELLGSIEVVPAKIEFDEPERLRALLAACLR